MSEVNLTAELTRMFLTVKAFENALAVSKEIDNLEANVQKKKKQILELDDKLKKSGLLLETELDKISDEVGQVRKKAMEDIEVLRVEYAKDKAALDKKITALNEDAKKLDIKIKAKTDKVAELDIEIAQKEKDLNSFNKEIEDTKAKFRSMF